MSIYLQNYSYNHKKMCEPHSQVKKGYKKGLHESNFSWQKKSFPKYGVEDSWGLEIPQTATRSWEDK